MLDTNVHFILMLLYRKKNQKHTVAFKSSFNVKLITKTFSVKY